jgi:hypothetical protein
MTSKIFLKAFVTVLGDLIITGKKVKLSHYSTEQTQRVPGGLGSQIS